MTSACKILLIEDDRETADYVAHGLRELGHTVDVAGDGAEGLFLATEESGYQLLIVDRMLPRLDGLAIVKTLRDTGLNTPVLFLTTLGGIDDRVEGLEAGGDDYLTKPFAFAELVARVQALARRPPLQSEATVLRVADLTMDLVKRRVWRADRAIDLQPREFRLLEYLMRHADEVVTRTMLLEQVWDFHFEPKTSVVETHISRLRTKIDRGFDTPLIHTVRGAGYSLYADA
ncbi:winged helix-turn-helix domain-containing protein [Salinisphaera hydrothermalis]|uniref:Transcriptional regulator n=1 Tax=Salinisphaera hydrothermalis (strain C41B8) TaxID=1304275 RepID=A0A084INA0_SALHC|nr:response regulator transcription factor [Salinisphaera hydrothermalis]KEZ78184.1 transcriptional regulator [Salinisphaera hydrothermalis C41B8]